MKWITNWSNAISIADARPEGYAKDITLRYPIVSVFDGTKIRITLDNFTGKERVHFEKVTIAKAKNDQDIDVQTLKTITFYGQQTIDINPGDSMVSDEIDFTCIKGETFSISIYLSDFTSMRAGVTTIGPLSKGYFAHQNQCEAEVFPREKSKDIAWFYFLSDVEVYTEDKNEAILCFGDSITAQAWPEFLQLKLINKGISTPRKAVSGARVLREYTCTMYEPYGLKSATRFPHDTNINGCDKVIVLQGINDFIHPVGEDVNIFRPMSDLPTANELIDGYRNMIRIAKEKQWKIYIGTLLPIKGWRTYAPFREDLRQEVNHWIRTTKEIDGYVDFDAYMKNPEDPNALLPLFDSGDHLHPSMKGYEKMAEVAFDALKKYEVIQ